MHDGHHQGETSASSIVAGMWCRISFSAGSPKMKLTCRNRPDDDALQEDSRYCSWIGLIQAKCVLIVAFDLCLVGLGVDQHVHRVADQC